MDIVKKYHFYAAHRNKKAGEKCSRLHGHTYKVKIHIAVNVIRNSTGILFSEIDNRIEEILKDYDHYLILWKEDKLCEILKLANESFKEVNFETSVENFAIWLFFRIKNETGLPINKIELSETESSNVIYEGKEIKGK